MSSFPPVALKVLLAFMFSHQIRLCLHMAPCFSLLPEPVKSCQLPNFQAWRDFFFKIYFSFNYVGVGSADMGADA